jgi:hypothetical protein
VLIGGAAAGAAALVTGTASGASAIGARADMADAATPLTLAGDGFSISASGRTVSVLDASGVRRLDLTGYRIGSTSPHDGAASAGAAPDGTPAIIVDWQIAIAGAALRGTFVPRGRRLEVTYDITAPSSSSMNGGMMRREVVGAGYTENYTGLADWTTDSRGGVPYQTAGTGLFEEAFDGVSVYINAPGTNPSWKDSTAINLPGSKVSEGVYRAVANIVVAEHDRPVVIGAMATGTPLATDVWTDQAFNIWNATSASPVVHGLAYNGTGDARAVTLAWVATDFDGKVVAKYNKTVTIGAYATVSSDLTIPPMGRGIAFVEFRISAGSDQSFARTNVAVLPPHSFTEGPATSTIGIAADYLLGGEAERSLLKRLGMRWSRHPLFTPEELATYGFQQNRLRTPASLDAFEGDPAAKQIYMDSEIQLATSQQAMHYELANEWNFHGGKALTGEGAEDYVNKWIAPFRERLTAAGSDLKLMSVSLAGMDYVYANKMFDAGLGDHVDAFGLHPGRGNFTPDFAPDPATWGQGSSGTYWNFLGAVREGRRVLAERTPAGKTIELWLTEVYACTQPNSWWHDTYRHAAENVLLSQVLALSEGVRNAQWYQFYDNVKANPNGANPSNPEYHYGLMLRDHSPKPSMLAFAASAEALDGATFVRWLTFDDENVRGLLFDTPKGPMSVLWSRADGYVLNGESAPYDDGFYPAEEPWVDTWTSKTTVKIPASGIVTAVDVIGRDRKVAVRGGKAAVQLDGAPRIFYGLDFTAHQAGEPVVDGPVSVKVQNVNGTAQVAVHVVNTLGSNATVTVRTAFGSKTFKRVARGAAVYQLFDSGAPSVKAGAVKVTTVSGSAKHRKRDHRVVRYQAYDTRPFA